MGNRSFPWVKCGWGVLLTTHPFYCRGHGRVELYLYPPSGPHRSCNGITLPLPYHLHIDCKWLHCSSFLPFSFWPLIPNHCTCMNVIVAYEHTQLHTHTHILRHTTHSRTPLNEGSARRKTTWQNMKITRDRQSSPRWDSNTQSQKESVCSPTPMLWVSNCKGRCTKTSWHFYTCQYLHVT